MGFGVWGWMWGSTALCSVPEWAMETLCDGTNYASLSYTQGRVCPSPFCSYPPLYASGSAITSRWFKGKKHMCQESARNFRVAFHHCHCVDIPQGQFDLSPHAALPTSPHPPGLAHLPLHWCSWCWEISRGGGISQDSPEQDLTGGSWDGHGWFWFGVNGNRRVCPVCRR